METGCISPPGVWDGEVANGQNSFALDQWVDAKWKVNRRSSWWVAGETNNGAQSLELRRSCSASWVFPSSSYPVRNRSLLKERRPRESSESGYFRGERSPDVKLFLPVPLPSTSSQFSRAIRSISRTLFQIFALVSLISDLMFFFLVSCVSFLLLLNSMSLPPLPPWTRQTRILSLPTCRDFLAFLPIHFAAAVSSSPSDNPDPGARISILDLPDLAMEIILSKLPLAGLCTMAAVCSSMREKCRSNHLWGTHLEKKWGSLMGSSAAQTAWKSFLSSNQGIEVSGCHRSRWLGALTSKLNLYDTTRPLFFDNSNMSKYLAIETGKFSFPAQVFNREVLLFSSYILNLRVQAVLIRDRRESHRTGISGSCCHVTTQSLSTIIVRTPSRRGICRMGQERRWSRKEFHGRGSGLRKWKP